MSHIIGLDFETTGFLDPDEHGENRIIEVAALVYDADGKLKGKLEQRFNPGRPIPPKAVDVHGITYDMVAHEPQFGEKAPKLAALLRSATRIVAHNGLGFDLPFLNKELIALGIAPVNKALMFDTMLESPWATFFAKRPNLGELCFALDVEYDPTKAHAALYDVEVMMKCYFEGVRRGVYPALPAEVA